MYRSILILAGTALVLGAAGCSDQPVAPDDETINADLIALDDYGFMQGRGPGAGCATGPGTCFGAGTGAPGSYLGTLVREVYARLLAEQGEEAADAALAKLWQLHQEAFALRSAGDRDAFLAAMSAAHQESVRLVIEVLGTDPAPLVVQKAVTQLDILKALIAERQAAGLDVTRLQYVADRATNFLASAQAALATGDAAGALDWGSRALQAATVGGGQKAGMKQRQRGGR